ncbi:hypothetical protein BC835DRAFT_514654 [Cytidiella melzeri]|nr:hypothetical protein BC835DRAFT_514654 [Cytidiella melzeri]
MKIPTPNNHAFILRRLDTGAVSSTTMFRAAFPTATEEAERAESSWVKTRWNVSGANKQGSARFAGTWVTPDVAVELAQDYRLTPVIETLISASPDPTVVFRKSGKALQQPTPVASPVSAATHLGDTPPVKRRREASPATTPTRSQIPVPSQPTPRRGATPQRAAATLASPRRSARLMSPVSTPAPTIVSSAKKVMSTVEEVSNEATIEARQVAEQNMEEDIREQKELVSRLKAEAGVKAQAALEAARVVVGADSVADVELTVSSDTSTVTKRAREEDSTEYTLNIKEPEIGERAIVTNRRVQAGRLGPEQKTLAWGALLFAAGVGAMSFIPSLPSFF